MNRKESKEDKERCRVWDAVFTEGAMEIGDVARFTELAHARIAYLIDHEWFTKMHGMVYIATYGGVPARKGVRLY